MKSLFLLALGFSLVVTVVSGQSGAYWTQANGPYGGTYTLTRTITGTLYARHASYPADNAYYRSDDDGLTWQELPELTNSTSLHPMIFGMAGNIFNINGPAWQKSSDEGQSWVALGTANGSENVYDILELPSGDLVGYTSNYFYRSPDGGQSWIQDTSLVTFTMYRYPHKIERMTTGDLIAYPRSISGDTTAYFYRTSNEGLSWEKVDLPYGYSPILYALSGTLFAVAYNPNQPAAPPQLYRSESPGVYSPVAVDSTQTINQFNLLNLPSGSLLLATKYGIYRSADDGISWHKRNPVSVRGNPATGFKSFQNLLHGSGEGIFVNVEDATLRSQDGGDTWAFCETGIRRAIVDDLQFVTEQKRYALTTTGLFKTTDGGEHWQRLTEHWGTNYHSIRLAQTPLGGTLLVQSGRLLWSPNNTDIFTDISPPQGTWSGLNKLHIDPSGQTFFVPSSTGMLRSDDQGASWDLVVPDTSFWDMVFLPSGRILATGLYDYIHVSEDNGQSWQQRLIAPGKYVFGGAMDGNGVIYLLANTESPDLKSFLFKSIDQGFTWAEYPLDIGVNLFTYINTDLKFDLEGHLFLSNLDEVFRSSNGGQTWQTLPSPPKPSIGLYAIRNLTLSPEQFLYIGTNAHGSYRSVSRVSDGAYVRGSVNIDADAECSTLDAQTPLNNWTVEAQSAHTYYTTTGADGKYQLFVDTGLCTLSLSLPNSIWWGTCDSVQNLFLDSLNFIDTADFTVLALSECPLMTVDLTIPRLRRCFDNTVYVGYCNQGSETADSAWVDIALDPYLALVNSAQPYSPLGNNTYRFFVGNIVPGQCGDFTLTVHVDCDSTILGQTHCITAHGYPDTLCTTVPAWSGAEIQANITCQDTVVYFELKNAGPVPSQTLDYIIIEDDVVLMSGEEQYGPGEIHSVSLPANGHTWRIESQQEPGHPFATTNHINMAFAEGCGGFETLGFINQFPVDAFTPSWDRDCIENTGAYDPNDKQGFPNGYSAEHIIRPGQELEYLIRFQNTGTDTAFTVVIRDTLSPWLDPASVRPGASSHDYTWNLSGHGVLNFTFNNILLPDSNVNLAGSQGFVSFRIEQQPGIPLGAVIFNEADIYFDFNTPVLTNETWHTVGVLPTVGLKPAPDWRAPSEILVHPQPATTFAVFQRADKKPFKNHRLQLFNVLGHSVRSLELNGSEYRFERKGLADGLYLFLIETAEGRYFGSGRLILQP